MKDALEYLGNTISDIKEFSRDAVHIAVVPVMNLSSIRLTPGLRIRVDPTGLIPISCIGEANAIVDPFLDHPVPPGDSFFAMMYPRTTTGLTHVWSHPDFASDPDIVFEDALSIIAGNTPSMKFLEETARGIGVDVTTVIEKATQFQENGEVWVGGEDFMDQFADGEFWDAWEKVTRKKAVTRDSFFRCAC
jgi:hypothetical protein|tara:strand:- start:996 stop:1568 length:573 start_codon:yes stop_codon:yes gene_type:complete